MSDDFTTDTEILDAPADEQQVDPTDAVDVSFDLSSDAEAADAADDEAEE